MDVDFNSGDIMTFPILWRLLFWCWLASEILVGIVTRTKRSRGKVQDRGSLLILWIIIATSITACQWISEATRPNMFGGAHALKTAGAIVMLVALAVRWTAIFTLGKSFSSNVAIQDSQQIISVHVDVRQQAHILTIRRRWRARAEIDPDVILVHQHGR